MNKTHNTYKSEKGIVTFKSYPNIAIVKYWGKTNIQIPVNPSISFTLKKSHTQTKIEYSYNPSTDSINVEFRFDDKPQDTFKKKLIVFLERVQDFIPWVKHYSLKIESKNNFPHSSGIASSASSYSAISLCLAKIHYQITGTKISQNTISEIARLGSGSACRSVYGGWNLWGESLLKNSSNYYAININKTIHPNFNTIHDAILVVSNQPKKVSSSAGHQLMENHPYKEGRIKQANENTIKLQKILSQGNWKEFVELCELEALSLHGLMFSSTPSYTLLEPNSLKIVQEIKWFREQNNIPICFTIDAGPNIHVLYPDSDKEKVKHFIESSLKKYCANKIVIYDQIGDGPIEI